MQPESFPESQDYCDWRESKSVSPFFHSLLMCEKLSSSLQKFRITKVIAVLRISA
jgi:hypothetical protein